MRVRVHAHASVSTSARCRARADPRLRCVGSQRRHPDTTRSAARHPAAIANACTHSNMRACFSLQRNATQRHAPQRHAPQRVARGLVRGRDRRPSCAGTGTRADETRCLRDRPLDIRSCGESHSMPAHAAMRRVVARSDSRTASPCKQGGRTRRPLRASRDGHLALGPYRRRVVRAGSLRSVAAIGAPANTDQEPSEPGIDHRIGGPATPRRRPQIGVRNAFRPCPQAAFRLVHRWGDFRPMAESIWCCTLPTHPLTAASEGPP